MKIANPWITVTAKSDIIHKTSIIYRTLYYDPQIYLLKAVGKRLFILIITSKGPQSLVH